MAVLESFRRRLTTTQSSIFVEIIQMFAMLVLREFLKLCVGAVVVFKVHSKVSETTQPRAQKEVFGTSLDHF